MARSPRYHLKNHRMTADPDRLYVCEECKIPKLAKAFFRSNNKSGIKYGNRCRVCSNAQHGRNIREFNKRLKSDPSVAIKMIEGLGPRPSPIKDGWPKYMTWIQQRRAILAKAGLIPKNPFDPVIHFMRRAKYGHISQEEAEKRIEIYYERHPECRPKPEGGVQRPGVSNI